MTLCVAKLHHRLIRSLVVRSSLRNVLNCRTIAAKAHDRCVLAPANVLSTKHHTHHMHHMYRMYQPRQLILWKQPCCCLSNDVKRPDHKSDTQPNPSVTSGEDATPEDPEEVVKSFDQELAELPIFQRYMKLFKEYWYVLVPVHGVTSVLWFGSMYLFAKR